jgi:hypothetical protein
MLQAVREEILHKDALAVAFVIFLLPTSQTYGLKKYNGVVSKISVLSCLPIKVGKSTA